LAPHLQNWPSSHTFPSIPNGHQWRCHLRLNHKVHLGRNRFQIALILQVAEGNLSQEVVYLAQRLPETIFKLK